MNRRNQSANPIASHTLVILGLRDSRSGVLNGYPGSCIRGSERGIEAVEVREAAAAVLAAPAEISGDAHPAAGEFLTTRAGDRLERPTPVPQWL